jgi:hypothetical protein
LKPHVIVSVVAIPDPALTTAAAQAPDAMEDVPRTAVLFATVTAPPPVDVALPLTQL